MLPCVWFVPNPGVKLHERNEYAGGFLFYVFFCKKAFARGTER